MSVEARAMALTVAYAAGAEMGRGWQILPIRAVALAVFPNDGAMRASFVNGYVDQFGLPIVAGNERVGAGLR